MAVIDTSVYVTLINPNETAHEAAWAWYVNAIREGEPLVEASHAASVRPRPRAGL